MSKSKKPARGGAWTSQRSSSISLERHSAQPPRFITLLTDFGLSDPYVGVMKGVIARINPLAAVIDLCHEVKPQNIEQAAFLLASSYAYFPAGAIHVAVVDPTVGGKRRAVCVKAGDFSFIGPDNGILSLACSRAGIKEIRLLENAEFFLEPVSRTFQGRDVFAPAAAHLSAGASFESMGRRIRKLQNDRLPQPEVGLRSIKGRIVYTDNFGNLISNIGREAIAKAFGKRKESFIVKVGDTRIKGLRETYCDVAPGMAAALFGSYDLLEIAIRDGNAAEILKAGEGAEMVIEAAGNQRRIRGQR